MLNMLIGVQEYAYSGVILIAAVSRMVGTTRLLDEFGSFVLDSCLNAILKQGTEMSSAWEVHSGGYIYTKPVSAKHCRAAVLGQA